jgi:hypothetical protein
VVRCDGRRRGRGDCSGETAMSLHVCLLGRAAATGARARQRMWAARAAPLLSSRLGASEGGRVQRGVVVWPQARETLDSRVDA